MLCLGAIALWWAMPTTTLFISSTNNQQQITNNKENRFQPRNRVSYIILGINAEIFARNPVSQPTG